MLVDGIKSLCFGRRCWKWKRARAAQYTRRALHLRKQTSIQIIRLFIYSEMKDMCAVVSGDRVNLRERVHMRLYRCVRLILCASDRRSIDDRVCVHNCPVHDVEINLNIFLDLFIATMMIVTDAAIIQADVCAVSFVSWIARRKEKGHWLVGMSC